MNTTTANQHATRALPPIIPTAVAFILTALATYAFLFGATWSGVFNPARVRPSLIVLAVACGAWLLYRAARRLPWSATALDGVLPLWVFAIALSVAANSVLLQRTLMGVWFAALYVLVYYLLQDMLGSGKLRLSALVDALLFSGAFVVFTALGQIGTRDRISGSLENPNILGAFLVLLIGVAAGRLLTVSGMARRVMNVYVALALITLFLSASRGAWLGVAAGAAFGGLVLYGARLDARARRALALGVLIVVVAVGALTLTRDATGRIEMAREAWLRFTAQPLTGSGLFTFKYRERVPEDPTRTIMQVHAHNAVLQVGAEMGLPGLIALGLTVVGVGAAAWRGYQAATSQRERLLRLGGMCGLIGFGVHSLVDFAVMNPAVALCLLCVLGIAAPPVRARRSAWRWLALPLLAALLIVLVVGGLINNADYGLSLLEAVNRGRP
jgi:O-antigen ligase